jgi:hypothetical protein
VGSTHHDEVGDDEEEPRGPKRAPRQGTKEVCGGEARGGEAGEEYRRPGDEDGEVAGRGGPPRRRRRQEGVRERVTNSRRGPRGNVRERSRRREERGRGTVAQNPGPSREDWEGSGRGAGGEGGVEREERARHWRRRSRSLKSELGKQPSRRRRSHRSQRKSLKAWAFPFLFWDDVAL